MIMENLKSIKKYIEKNILSFTLGLLIISSIIWNRAIRERLPKTLIDFQTSFMIIIVIINIILHLTIIIITIWIIFYNNQNKKKSRFATYLITNAFINKTFYYLQNIREKLAESPKTVYKLLYNIYNVSHILEIPFYKISHFIKNLPIKYAFILTIIHLIFHTIPKIIPALVFISEILLFGQIQYFYLSLYLYIIVTLYHALLWILADLADNNTCYITAHVNIDYIEGGHGDYTATFKDKIPDIEDATDIISRRCDQALLDWFVYNYDVYVDIKWLVYRLDLKKKKLRFYETLFISTLYLIGWSYILFINFI